MNRQDTIATLRTIGAEVAKDFGYHEYIETEDRQKGIWGEEATKSLEADYGECTHECEWKGSEKDDWVRFRYRFANPCLAVSMHTGTEQIFAEIELKSAEYKEDKLVHLSDTKIAEIHCFGYDGFDLASALRIKIAERILNKPANQNS